MFKICHLTSVHPWDDIRIFYKECCTLAQNSYEVHFVVPGSEAKKVNGVHIQSVTRGTGNRFTRMTKTVCDVYRAGCELDADLYHFHDPELLPVGMLFKLRGKIVIYDAHEDLPRQVFSKPWIKPIFKKPLSWLIERFENFIARRLDCVITATSHIESRFKQAGCVTKTINNYPMLYEFTMPVSDWAKKDQAVCYVGGITEIRGIKEMVAAIGFTGARLLLAGSFSSPELRNQLISLPAWASVVEFGQLDRKAVMDLFTRSVAGLVVFHPVPNHLEAQPNKIYEYMAAGIPVIASNFPLWRQIIEKHKCGICVDPLDPNSIAEAINYLIMNLDVAYRLGENGRRAIEEKYTWECEGEKLKVIYQELFQRGETV